MIPFPLLHHLLHFTHSTLSLTLSHLTKEPNSTYDLGSSQFFQDIHQRNSAPVVALTGEKFNFLVGSEKRDNVISDSNLHSSPTVVILFHRIETAGSNADDYAIELNFKCHQVHSAAQGLRDSHYICILESDRWRK